MGINFGSDTECVAVGANFSWEPFFIPSECCTTFGFSAGKVFFGSSFVPEADLLIGDLQPIQQSAHQQILLLLNISHKNNSLVPPLHFWEI